MTETHCGFVTILGPSNAGKSTLINALVGTKVSIVSPKVQTTRFKVRGILNQDHTQIIFIDTPGIFKPIRKLDRAMIQNAWEETETADICLLLIDAKKGLDAAAASMLETFKKEKRPVVLGLNKIDLIPKEELLPLIDRLNAAYPFEQTFLISALKNQGLEELKQYFIDRMPVSPWFFPDNQLTDISDRLFSAEMTREKVFLYLQQELPYSIYVTTQSFVETEESITIKQDIIVERPSQKTIILGKNGQMIKKIGMAARRELTALFGKKVNLFLFVQVNKNWAMEKQAYTQMGLNFDVKN